MSRYPSPALLTLIVLVLAPSSLSAQVEEEVDWFKSGWYVGASVGFANSGANGQDLLIGGYTSHDADVDVLDQIMAEWKSSDNYNTRVNNILASFLQPDVTVFDDGFADDLQGGSDRDWYFAELDGLDGDDDNIAEVSSDELIELLDLV